MNTTELEKLIAAGKTQRAIAKELTVSQGTVRFWLSKLGLRTCRGPHNKATTWRCKCGEVDRTKFYGHKHNICAACHNRYTVAVGNDKIVKIRELLGGACAYCGYAEYQCALDFHHLDPTVKDGALTAMRGWSWQRIYRELPKGVLLCKNCHAAVTSGMLLLHQRVGEPGTPPALGAGLSLVRIQPR